MCCVGLPVTRANWTHCYRICRTGNVSDDDSIETDNWRPPKYSFFESPQGLAVLHRMLVALHLVFGQSHDCGIQSIGWFLELSELDAFIASSFRSQQKVASQVEPVSNFLILQAYELSKATSLALNRQEQQAQQAADVFQRSSSCVEGRNGQLCFDIMACVD